MQDAENTFDGALFDGALADLPKGAWLKKLAQLSAEHGFFNPLGSRHFASFVEKGPTLFVTFETIQGIRGLSETAQPMGWNMMAQQGWSHLCMVSDGDTWFRDPHVYAQLDELTDEGFFDNFDQVIFYGAGPCGYAAAAFSVAAPGATVVAVQPQATLDPRITEWDDRFTELRRTNFADRYGYAPEMLDAAHHAYVIYDPCENLDAMHAALFTRANVTKFRLRYMGAAIQTDLMSMDILFRVIAKASAGHLGTVEFAKLLRARREHGSYLRNLLQRVEQQERPKLAHALCANVTSRIKAPRFANRLKQLNDQLADNADEPRDLDA